MTLVGTHSGRFHCDEVVAFAILSSIKRLHPVTCLRTRDESELEKCDIVLDVGGKFDLDSNRFDHHQISFKETFSPQSQLVLSSAGLVYKYFGKELIAQDHPSLDEDDRIWAFTSFYERFVRSVDGWDNGIDATQEKPVYLDRTTLAHRIHMLNQQVRTPDTSEQDKRFRIATKIAMNEIKEHMDYIVSHLCQSAKILKRLVDKDIIKVANGYYLEIPHGLSWEENLSSLENLVRIDYIFWQDEKGHWCIQTPRVHDGSFKSRRPFPNPWCGLRDDSLVRKTGIFGAHFCHRGGFFAVALTRKAAVEMIEASIKYKS